MAVILDKSTLSRSLSVNLDHMATLRQVRHTSYPSLTTAAGICEVAGADGAVVMTSRISVELIQKTAKLGAGVLIGISAPTALGIDMAGRAGMTLVALARGEDFEIFTGPGRIKLGAEADAA